MYQHQHVDSRTASFVRTLFINSITNFFENEEMEALRIDGNKIAVPWAQNGKEGYVYITVSIPKDTRSGEPFDGHVRAEAYAKEVMRKKRNRRNSKMRLAKTYLEKYEKLMAELAEEGE